jgi:hypothetical protein
MAHVSHGEQPTSSADRPLRLPAVLDRGGGRGWGGVVVAGAVLGGATLVIPALFGDDVAFGFLAVLLGMIAGVYLGFALADGRLRALRTEYAGIVVHGALAIVALATGSALVLAAGYLCHAVWDSLHPRTVDTVVPWWYVPLCVGYDVVVGVYVLVRFL